MSLRPCPTPARSVPNVAPRCLGALPALGLCLGAFSALASDPFTTAEWPTLATRLQDRVRLEVKQKRAPSLGCVVVVHGHEPIIFVDGEARLDPSLPATTTTVYELGSCAKLFTGLMFLQLRDAGQVTLDAPLSQHLREFSLPGPDGLSAHPTFRQLLSHTSGLPNIGPVDHMTTLQPVELSHLLHRLPEASAPYPPLTRYKYSNLGIDLAGIALSRIASEPWHSYVQSRLLTPLEMKEAATRLPLPDTRTLATGYLPIGPDGAWVAGTPMPFTEATAPSGALYASADDLASFLKWFLDGGDPRVLSAVSRREMVTALWMLDDWSAGVGIAWFLQQFEGHVLAHHAGGTVGHSAAIAVIPSLNLGVAVVANGLYDAHGFARELLHEALPLARSIHRQRQPTWAPLPDTAASICGTYSPATSLMPPVQLRIIDGRMTLQCLLFGNALLEPLPRPDHYIAHDNETLDGESVIIDRAADGRPIRLIVGHGSLIFDRTDRQSSSSQPSNPTTTPSSRQQP